MVTAAQRVTEKVGWLPNDEVKIGLKLPVCTYIIIQSGPLVMFLMNRYLNETFRPLLLPELLYRLNEALTCVLGPVLSLEVMLQKCVVGTPWPELVMGDQRGELLISEEQAALVHERLSHLTSQDWLQVLHTVGEELFCCKVLLVNMMVKYKCWALSFRSSADLILFFLCRRSWMHVTLFNKAKANATLIFHVFFPLLIQNVNVEKDKLLNYNSAELEDCDVFPEAGFSMTHFDESLRPSQVVSNPRGTVLLLYALTRLDVMRGTFTVTCFN